ncbi:hypothetical protein F511_21550 [Dorcoceras hygrometricum]|uniref:Uncharacterized protein n=1 Tax=Dorcoceras hygrometricum TaxID=472368 RepID=A0A2Z7CB27_9LAMI|nr:hypothetical protein F511_21550 [Dorcoceras hygrometricum]
MNKFLVLTVMGQSPIYTTTPRSDLQFPQNSSELLYCSSLGTTDPIYPNYEPTRSRTTQLRPDYALRPAKSLQLSLQFPEPYTLPRPTRTSTAQLTQLSSDLKADKILGIALGASTNSLHTPTGLGAAAHGGATPRAGRAMPCALATHGGRDVRAASRAAARSMSAGLAHLVARRSRMVAAASHRCWVPFHERSRSLLLHPTAANCAIVAAIGGWAMLMCWCTGCAIGREWRATCTWLRRACRGRAWPCAAHDFRGAAAARRCSGDFVTAAFF